MATICPEPRVTALYTTPNEPLPERDTHSYTMPLASMTRRSAAWSMRVSRRGQEARVRTQLVRRVALVVLVRDGVAVAVHPRRASSDC